MVRMRMEVRGIVQGVGFRPFIHRLVTRFGFCGWVRNNSRGVDMELEGEEGALLEFARCISSEAPVLADVESVRTEILPELAHYTVFEIIESRTMASRDTLISPDIAVCPDCLREMRDPDNKRYRYPFLNCTNCGPRFTIIRDIPYDRAKTSMACFPMCPDCEREYHDITNRRYHAEPTCCADCGPELLWYGADGELHGEAALQAARELVRSGGILCVKGLGGMHLACLPERAEELRRRKQRDGKPFAVMCRDTAVASRFCEIDAFERRTLEGYRRPIVLLKKRERTAFPSVAENDRMGVMLPYTPLHYLLFGDDIDILLMTSANLSEKPILYRNEEALRELSGIADGFLLHDRDIVTRCDDSLLWCVDGKEYPARRSRGYVPYPVRSELLTRRILACGAEQKASFALSKPGCAFPSQHIGDLKNFETYENYSAQIDHFRRMFDITPECIVCDLHPDYLSTRRAEELAEELRVPLRRVQHHHAHMASCMADNDLTAPVIGLIWDGVGYGTDGTSWGGEWLCGDYSGFERRGHLRVMPLPGGDRAVEEIWRLGYALSREKALYSDHDTDTVDALLRSGLNCPLSSGMGRLFDAASSLMGIVQVASYEGEGAVLLESAADASVTDAYPYGTADNVLDWEPILCAVVRDRRNNVPVSVMAARFMNALCLAARDITANISRETGLREVVLSGGSFQNMYILSRLPALLHREGLTVFTHSRVSCNDEGICLGQLMIGQYS